MIPNDLAFAQQQGPEHVRAPEAWDLTLGTSEKNVRIVDPVCANPCSASSSAGRRG